MNLGGEVFPAFQPYGKATYEIYISGCGKEKKCKNCHNPLLQDFNYGIPIKIYDFLYKLKDRKEFFEAISILGGEFLDQDEKETLGFCIMLKETFFDKEFWLFTGKKIEEVPDWCKKIFDYIKVGPYIEELKQSGFPASSNQKLLKKGVDY